MVSLTFMLNKVAMECFEMFSEMSPNRKNLLAKQTLKSLFLIPCLSLIKLDNSNFCKWSQMMNKVKYFIFYEKMYSTVES
jgi:hypothetical protein